MEARFLLILGFAAGALIIKDNAVVGAEISTCAQLCPIGKDPHYSMGFTYTYTYEADTVTKIEGATEEHSSLHIQALAEIQVISKCEMLLKLHGVTLMDSHPSNYQLRSELGGSSAAQFKEELERHPLRFSFLEGRIGEVCPLVADEKTWVLNIKRGILSAFQTSDGNHQGGSFGAEEDVSGRCETEYRVLQSYGDMRVISKTKDLMSCTNRTSYTGPLQSVPYHVNSDYQNVPLVRGDYECQQTIKIGGYLQSATCTETNLFRPFSNNGNGALTRTAQRLRYLGKQQGINDVPALNMRSALLFDHRPDSDGRVADNHLVREKLTELCAASRDSVSSATPGLFSQLVHAMSPLDVDDLRTIYDSAQELCPKAKSHIEDVLPMIGSTASVVFMSELIDANSISQPQTHIWLRSIAFTPKPTAEMISALSNLVLNPEITSKSYLAISSLVHGYCRVTSDCGDDWSVRRLLEIFTSKLGETCDTRQVDYQTVVMSLIALGNIGHTPTETMFALYGCFNKTDNPLEIRLAAIRAHRRTSCESMQPVTFEQLIGLMSNTEEESELRAAAYLALIRCPYPSNLEAIRGVLQGGIKRKRSVEHFIWSHLTNLVESSDVHKQELGRAVENGILKKLCDLPMELMGGSVEWSAFSKESNVGAKFEFHFIDSAKHPGFVPDSMMANFTVDMFGHSVNLFEINYRHRSYSDILTSVKVFGNEIHYLNKADMKEAMDKLDPFKVLAKLSQQHDIEVAKNAMFLNSKMAIPTISGLPLTLAVDGVVSLNIKIKGKASVLNPSNIDINGEIAPSGAVVVNCAMGVDAGVAKTGLKMTTSLHSNMAASMIVQLNNSRIAKLNLKVPSQKMEVFGFKNTFFVEHRGVLREQRMLTRDSYDVSKCIASQFLEEYFGVGVCATLQYPNAYQTEGAPYFPLTGPVTAQLDILNKDAANGYTLGAAYEENNNGKTGHLYFGTPGSRINRNHMFDISTNSRDINFKMEIPMKTVDISGSLNPCPSGLCVNSTVKVDSDIYALNAKMQREAKYQQTTYSTTVDVTTPEGEHISVTGSHILKTTGSQRLRRVNITMDSGSQSKYIFVTELKEDGRGRYVTYSPSIAISGSGNKDIAINVSAEISRYRGSRIHINLTNIFKEPLTFTGKVHRVKSHKYVISDTELHSQWIHGNISGFFYRPFYNYRIRSDYLVKDSPMHSITISQTNQEMNLGRQRGRLRSKSDMISTQFPNWNRELLAEVFMEFDFFEIKLDFDHGTYYKLKKYKSRAASSLVVLIDHNIILVDI